MRVYLYVVTGLCFALLGWNVAQFGLYEADALAIFPVPELLIYPSVTVCLCLGIAITEAFVSNPTRPRLNLRILPIPLLIAVMVGLVLGLVAALGLWLLYEVDTGLGARTVRIISWLAIAIAVGLVDGLAWFWNSVEAGNTARFWRRLLTSVCVSSVAALLGAAFFEGLRTLNLPPDLFRFEDPFGFAVLGSLLGLGLGLTGSPSYQVALRAGAGFEYHGTSNLGVIFDAETEVDPDLEPDDHLQEPGIAAPLGFVADYDQDVIEEGMSIRLPSRGKVLIGSAADAHLRLPGLPAHLGTLELNRRDAKFTLRTEKYRDLVEVSNSPISRKVFKLRHNHVIKFRHLKSPDQFYRFIFYNRALDPRA